MSNLVLRLRFAEERSFSNHINDHLPLSLPRLKQWLTKTGGRYVPVRVETLINNSAWWAFKLMFIGLLHQNKCCLNYLICQLSGFLFPFYHQCKFNLRSQTGKGILILSNVLHSEIPLSQVNPVADAVVPVGGAPTLPGYQRFRQISKKLHEIENILVRRGRRGGSHRGRP